MTPQIVCFVEIGNIDYINVLVQYVERLQYGGVGCQSHGKLDAGCVPAH